MKSITTLKGFTKGDKRIIRAGVRQALYYGVIATDAECGEFMLYQLNLDAATNVSELRGWRGLRFEAFCLHVDLVQKIQDRESKTDEKETRAKPSEPSVRGFNSALAGPVDAEQYIHKLEGVLKGMLVYAPSGTVNDYYKLLGWS